MNEQKRKKLVYGLLALAIIWGIYNFLPKTKPGTAIGSDHLDPTAIQIVTQTNAVEKSINIAEMKSKSWGNNPFRATKNYAGTPEKTEDVLWRLSGILYNSSKPLAIINGKSVAVGSKLGSATVIAIKKKSVVLEFSGTHVTLRVSKG